MAEFAATGALVIFSFHGLSEGKSWLPMRLGVMRGSSASNRRGGRGADDMAGPFRRSRVRNVRGRGGPG